MMISERDEALLEAISNYKTLFPEEQERLRPLLEETIARHKITGRCSKVIDDFLEKYDLGIMIQNN